MASGLARVSLALLLTALLAFGTSVVPARAQTSDITDQEWDLAALINRSRFDAGLEPLVVRADVRAIARTWSTTMAATGRLTHNPLMFSQVRAALPAANSAGENIARASDAARVHQLWTESAPHRANMLGAYRYLGVGAAGGLWATAVFVGAPEGLPGITRVPVRRMSGADAIDTSLRVSRGSVTDAAADAVVIARSDHFADALVGAPLAGAGRGPVLLSARDGVREEIVREARRVLGPTGTVYLMGGPGALSPAVEAAFATQGLRVQRVAGSDRFQTAAKAAALLAPTPSTVLLVSGEGFADALSAGVPAAVHRMPVLLTGRDALPAPTSVYLAAHRAARRIVVGGPAAVSDAVARQAGAAERLAGSNRYATAVRVAQRWFPRPAGVWAATGERHQDALIAVPAAARARHPLLLVPPTGERTLYDYSREVLAGLTQATVVGGAAGVRDPVLSLLFN